MPTAKEREAGTAFLPKFDAHGLLCAVVQDADTDAVLMVAYMDREALQRTVETGFACFYSRSRKAQWMKGETSGNTLAVEEIRVDCDQDTIAVARQTDGSGLSHRRADLFLSSFGRRKAGADRHLTFT